MSFSTSDIHSPLLTELLSQSNRLNNSQINLYDVGCSGGIDFHWTVLDNHLCVVGFDPLIEEIERLNSLNAPLHKYVNAFVSNTGRASDSVEDTQLTNNFSFHRTSAFLAQQLMKQRGSSYIQEEFNGGKKPSYSKNFITLDEFIEKNPQTSPHFLKIDTDGSDIKVLKGATRLLKNQDLFAIQVEAQFHGGIDKNSNTFSNIDQILRKAGFSLMGLDTWNYTRAALPGDFVYEIAAQTHQGSIQWGEALYFRDSTTNAKFKKSLENNPENIWRYLVLLALFGLSDVAVDSLLSLSPRRTSFLDTNAILNSTVIGNPFGVDTYDEYIQLFEDDFANFFPKKADENSPDDHNEISLESGEASHPERQISKLKSIVHRFLRQP